MTDIAKAIAFATHCLKWPEVLGPKNTQPMLLCNGENPIASFNPDSFEDVTNLLREFLKDRYFIQINRDKTGLFQWQVLVGQQGLTQPGANREHARAENEDLLDAIFDACVEAARTDRREHNACPAAS